MSNIKHDKLKHPCFPQPHNPEIRIWRYMDLSKFIDLISRKHLFLCRLDLLGDSHEGSVTKAFYHARNENYKKYGIDNIISFQEESSKKSNKSLFINCWYFNQHESEAMWKLYCPDNRGIAIQTTYKKLVQSIEYDDFLYIGPVNYIDYETEWFPDGNMFYPPMHKRKAFEFEKEVRLVKTDSKYWLQNSEDPPVGIHVPWDIQRFCERIYVNPYSEEWFHDVVKDVIEKYSCKIDLNWSVLKGKPYY